MTSTIYMTTRLFTTLALAGRVIDGGPTEGGV